MLFSRLTLNDLSPTLAVTCIVPSRVKSGLELAILICTFTANGSQTGTLKRQIFTRKTGAERGRRGHMVGNGDIDWLIGNESTRKRVIWKQNTWKFQTYSQINIKFEVLSEFTDKDTHAVFKYYKRALSIRWQCELTFFQIMYKRYFILAMTATYNSWWLLCWHFFCFKLIWSFLYVCLLRFRATCM